MAYLINASNSGLENASYAAVTAAPLTVSMFFKGASVTSFGRLLGIEDTATSTNYFALFNRGDIASDPVEWQVKAGDTTVGLARTTTGYSADTWTHAIGIEVASNSRAAYINAGDVGTDANSRTPSGIDHLGIGLVKVAAGYFYSNHNITVAEVAIWNVALGADERAALAAGFSPLLIRPANLINYWPLGGIYGNHYRDIVGGYDLTQVGTVTAAEHPRIIYPTAVSVSMYSAAAVGSPWYYFANQQAAA